ncbi:MAG TPA: M10 family metallopeptidase C-terminal domain-containing protein [Allosphingosinicella sp.]|nr:M10 family metallopeptidase C-terminal domain-containing protein [Allosphingosinicella sp.]
MRGLRSRSSSSDDTAVHVGAKGTLANIAAASAGELASYDLQLLQMSAAKLGNALAADGVGGSRPSSVAATTGFLVTPDNYQPVESAWYVPGPTALVDVYTAAPNTTGTLVVDDPNHVIAASDTPGDNDWFAVTLTAGQTYQFGQYAYVGGIPGAEGNGVPLADAYLEIYDSAGNLLALADGGGPNTPQGLDALMTFEATYSGTYYVNATSYDNTGDGIGDFAGDYEIFAITATGATVYTTHYDISSPLHSIDWGGVLVNREHVSVRNPDGMEGPRPTGEPAADPAEVEGNFLGFPGKNVVYIYFAGQGDIYANTGATIPVQVTAQDPYQYEIQAMLRAANEFSKVADVVFVSNYTLNPTTGLYERDPNIQYKPGPLGPEAGVQYATGVDDDFDADFFYWSYPGTPGPGISLLGSMNPPDYQDEGVAQFNSADERWSAQMLQPGGFSFVTLIHEFGHGMGLAHPHDTGGGSSVMQGVETNGVPGDDGGAGAFDLNQGVYTMMSYNDGWAMSPYGQAETNNEGYGWLGSLMALDIAVIQDKYGVNEDWATGNDTYVLKDVNEWGVYIDAATGQPAEHDPTDAATARDGYYVGESTYYSSIWDAGGADQIVYNGTRDTTIDLRPATLLYEYGGGGWMSYATGIYGGFTIANGVTIENAISGSGNDKLTGNAASNRMEGNGGNDAFYMWFGGGNDTVLGGAGNDTFFFGSAFTTGDTVRGGADVDTLVLQGNYNLALGTLLSEIEGISLLAGTNTGSGAPGTALYTYSITTHDSNFAAGIQAKINGAALLAGENFTFNGSAETNASFVVYGGKGTDTFTGGQGNDIFFFAEERFASGDTVNGGAGYDGMFLRGNYTIDFNAPGYTGLFTNIENLTLTSATDERYARGGGTEFDYNLVLSNALVGAGQMLTVNGGLLLATETMVVDGSQESDGNLRLFGGKAADTLKGGAQADSIHGNLGADSLTGNGGADTFQYHAAAESTTAGRDQILDFATGSDRIDLSRIDANTLSGGDQAFTWIGSNAFGGTGAASAGQLRAYQEGSNWFIEGDTNGDGVADLAIQLTAPAAGPVQSDFLL